MLFEIFCLDGDGKITHTINNIQEFAWVKEPRIKNEMSLSAIIDRFLPQSISEIVIQQDNKNIFRGRVKQQTERITREGRIVDFYAVSDTCAIDA